MAHETIFEGSVSATRGSVFPSLDINAERLATVGRLLIARTLTALAVFIGFWLLALVIHVLILKAVRSRKILSEDLLALIAAVTRMALLIFGAITALGTAGINVSA